MSDLGTYGKNRFIRLTALCALFLLACAFGGAGRGENPLFALPNTRAIPDSSGIRAKVKDEFFTAPISTLAGKMAREYYADDGTVFQVRVEVIDEAVCVVVAPSKPEKVDIYTDQGIVTQWRDAYPVGIPGSWVLYRDKNDGKPLCIRFYYAGTPDVYVQFKPGFRGAVEKATADIVVYGYYRVHNATVGQPLERFYTLSFADVQRLTEKSLPWETGSFYPEMYEPTLQMIAVIRENLDRFRSVPSIVYDEQGVPAYVGVRGGEMSVVRLPPDDTDTRLYTSSCGFVKWIADGLVRPVSGSGLLIDPLLASTVTQRTGSLAAAYASEYNMSLALDWTRNIATACLSVSTSRNYTYENSGVLVNTSVISGIYSPPTGYDIQALFPLMYTLAQAEPGRFYLGAIRERVPGSDEITVYNECVAFFPVLDEQSRFFCAVFMNGREYSLEEFIRMFEGDFVQLVRINASDQFFPR